MAKVEKMLAGGQYMAGTVSLARGMAFPDTLETVVLDYWTRHVRATLRAAVQGTRKLIIKV